METMKNLEINRDEFLMQHVSHIGIDSISKCVNDLVRNYYFLCDIHHRQMVCMMLNNKCYTRYIDDKIVKIAFDKEILNDFPQIKEYSDKLSEDEGIFIIEIPNHTQHNINGCLEHYRLFRFINYCDAFKLENGKIIGYCKDEEVFTYYEGVIFYMKITNYELPNILYELFLDNTFFKRSEYNSEYEGVIFYKNKI